MSTSQTVEIRFDLTVETDPLGARLSIGVPSAPSRDARAAFVESIEETLVGASDSLVDQAVAEAHDRLAAYGSRNDYDTESIRDSFAGVDATRSARGVTAAWHWEHEAAIYFEFGTSDHTIRGSPVLAFVWKDAPSGVKDRFSQARDAGGRFQSGTQVFFSEVEVSGLPEGRWLRDSLQWLRREVGQA